jgi:hypothetical protein
MALKDGRARHEIYIAHDKPQVVRFPIADNNIGRVPSTVPILASYITLRTGARLPISPSDKMEDHRHMVNSIRDPIDSKQRKERRGEYESKQS